MEICPKCGSGDVDNDDSAVVCMSCGHVLSESNITSDVTFAEGGDGSSSVVGQFVSESGHSSNRYLGRNISGQRQHREVTLANGRRRIMHLASALKLGTQHVDAAHRFFMLAVQHNFTQGRRTPNVIAACLYIVCRRQKTPHMLIDFSDVLQTNMFVLGSTFLKLCRILNIQPPLIDPSLYIHRFAAQLEFEGKEPEVANTALRLVQRMRRDWIQTGRRPAGICGAALLISARLHGFRRTQKDIIDVVKVCDLTLRKRLCEFDLTPSAQMTKEQFSAANPINHDDENETFYQPTQTQAAKKTGSNQANDQQSCNPPSYIKNKLREMGNTQPNAHLNPAALYLAQRADASKKSTNEASTNANSNNNQNDNQNNDDDDMFHMLPRKRKYLQSPASIANPNKRKKLRELEAQQYLPNLIEQQDLLIEDDDKPDEESMFGKDVEDQMEQVMQNEAHLYENMDPSQINRPKYEPIKEIIDDEPVITSESTANKQDDGKQAEQHQHDQDDSTIEYDASDIPDEEVEMYINNDAEYEAKSIIWHVLNQDYLDAMAEKQKEAAENANQPKEPKKRASRRGKKNDDTSQANQPKERSKNINWDALDAVRNNQLSKQNKNLFPFGEDDDEDMDENNQEDDMYDEGMALPPKPAPSEFLSKLKPTIPISSNSTQKSQSTTAAIDDDDEDEWDDEQDEDDVRSKLGLRTGYGDDEDEW